MEKKLETFQKIKLKYKDSEPFNENILIALTRLGYNKHSELKMSNGTWQIFCLEKKPEIKNVEKKGIILFFSIWNSLADGKKFLVSGMCDSIDEVMEGLKFISLIIPEQNQGLWKKFFSRTKKLSVENAQDYGYIRGLLVGIFLMFLDILPWHIGSFRPQGVLSTFLDYTRLVYYGTPGFAILVGMAAIGVYFTILFILLPIIVSHLYLRKAKCLEQNLAYSMPETLFDFEYGKDAEVSLDEQSRLQIENVKMEEIYKRVVAIWKNIKKEDFYELYEIFREGFITAENLYDILQRITRCCPEFNFERFLKIVTDVMKKDTQVTLTIVDKQ